MTVAFVAVQTPGGFYSTGTSGSFTPTNAGDLLLCLAINSAGGTQSVADSNAVSYTLVNPPGQFNSAASDSISLWTNPTAIANSQTVTVTDAGQSFFGGTVLEFSGVLSVNNGSAVSTPSSTTGTGGVQGTAVVVPTGAVLVAIAVNETGAATVTPASGGTLLDASINAGEYTVAGYVGSGASITPAFTVSVAGQFYTVIQAILNAPAPASTASIYWVS